MAWVRRLAVAAVLAIASVGAAVAGLATPAFAGTLMSPEWAVSNSAPGATGVDYTFTFTTATTSMLGSVTMTVPSGTGGTAAVGTVTPGTLDNMGSVSLSAGTLTYMTTPLTVSSGTAVSIEITGLANTSTPGSYTSVLTTYDAATTVDSGTTAAVTISGSLTLAAPSSLAWAPTQTGLDQSAVDTTSADQQLTVDDSTGTGSGWEIIVSATTFTDGAHTLPDTGRLDVTGSTSSLTSAAPTATCVGSCTLPTDTTTYPVTINTAASSPTAFTLYSASAGTGTGAVTIGGGSAANPIGWWIQVPASAFAGSYTSALTLTLVSGP